MRTVDIATSGEVPVSTSQMSSRIRTLAVAQLSA
jgi:hypothetical protein